LPGERYKEQSVQPIEMFKRPADGDNVAPAFVNGYSDGQAARIRNQALTAYLRVGIDDYAKGFRAGFYDRSASTRNSEITFRRHISKR
jgi:hypothetical protein